MARQRLTKLFGERRNFCVCMQPEMEPRFDDFWHLEKLQNSEMDDDKVAAYIAIFHK